MNKARLIITAINVEKITQAEAAPGFHLNFLDH